MSSKGTTLRAFRFNDTFWAEVEQTVQRRNLWTARKGWLRRSEEWSMSDFIRIAIKEKIKKMERSRRPRRRRGSLDVLAAAVAGDGRNG